MTRRTLGLAALVIGVLSAGSTLHAKAPPGRYVRLELEGGALVHDTVTGLQWTATSAPQPLSQPDARQYCLALTRGGFDDFVLPQRAQLITIMDLTGRGADHATPLPAQPYALDMSVFDDAPISGHWTDTRTIYDYSGTPEGARYWAVSASTGDLFDAPITETHPVRCMRRALPGRP